jgi:hypothetical protein
MKYEYKVATHASYHLHPEESESLLNKYGEDGWELAGMSAVNPTYPYTSHYLVFKRAYQEDIEMTIEKMICKMRALGNVAIHFSDHTNCFYCSIDNVEIKEGDFLCGVAPHKKTIDEAVRAMFNELVNADCIVVGAYRDNRKEYKYENGEFVLIRS